MILTPLAPWASVLSASASAYHLIERPSAATAMKKVLEPDPFRTVSVFG